MQDMSQAEAEENLRFYEQYASEHKKPVSPSMETPKVSSDVPPSIPPKTQSPAVTAGAVPPSLNDILSSPITATPVISTPPAAILPPPVVTVEKKPENKLENLAPAAAPPTAEPKNKPEDRTDAATSPAENLFPFHLMPDPNTTYPGQHKR